MTPIVYDHLYDYPEDRASALWTHAREFSSAAREQITRKLSEACGPGPQNHIEGTTKRTSIGLYISTTNFLLTTQNPYMTLKRKFHCYQILNDQIEQANQAAQIE